MTGKRGRVAERSAAALAAAAALVAAAFTVAVVALPFARFAYESPALRVMLETVNAIIAIVVGYVVYGRFREGRRLQDLLLGLALSTAAVAGLVLTAIPSAVQDGMGTLTGSWVPLGFRLVGATTVATAALVSGGRRADRRRAALTSTLFVLALVAVAVAGSVAAGSLPPVVDPAAVGDATRPQLVAHPAALGVLGLDALLYAVGAVAFVRQADRRQDPFLRWLAAGCTLSAVGRLHYVLYPSLYSDVVYTGDVLRLGFYLLLLVGAAQEITTYWRTRAQVAVLEDRRRMARELHDGVIQELSYIRAQYQRLSANPGDLAVVERIGGAAGRAIEESRRALAALTRPEDEHLPTALQRTVVALGEQYDVKVETEIDPRADVDGALADALLRITGEAIHNAVRHGQAARIRVRLTADPLSLLVADDGRGFTAHRPDDGPPSGFGLTSMNERAAGVGGTLAVQSAPGEGTTVRVTWS
ncbi:sensor histidine kinase [Actinotalea sp. Marseille-Q4924]|uniref:sensor histidine kinase n=1 Tax=Actinotalea sp. Marseille-Q4924 TaxID=2866571 RepID=UPI001CE439C7|nr:sensor histidine kinase [Actinotalea sp. Marseille-Q4924]